MERDVGTSRASSGTRRPTSRSRLCSSFSRFMSGKVVKAKEVVTERWTDRGTATAKSGNPLAAARHLEFESEFRCCVEFKRSVFSVY